MQSFPLHLQYEAARQAELLTAARSRRRWRRLGYRLTAVSSCTGC
jgi:hypothetical protein